MKAGKSGINGLILAAALAFAAPAPASYSVPAPPGAKRAPGVSYLAQYDIEDQSLFGSMRNRRQEPAETAEVPGKRGKSAVPRKSPEDLPLLGTDCGIDPERIHPGACDSPQTKPWLGIFQGLF